MRITMRHKMSGTRDGVEWPDPGGTVDLPDDEAALLLAQGMAVEVASVGMGPDETAAAKKR